jgi:hypothetical protein
LTVRDSLGHRPIIKAFRFPRQRNCSCYVSMASILHIESEHWAAKLPTDMSCREQCPPVHVFPIRGAISRATR